MDIYSLILYDFSRNVFAAYQNNFLHFDAGPAGGFGVGSSCDPLRRLLLLQMLQRTHRFHFPCENYLFCNFIFGDIEGSAKLNSGSAKDNY
jgi:hypothetical protein